MEVEEARCRLMKNLFHCEASWRGSLLSIWTLVVLHLFLFLFLVNPELGISGNWRLGINSYIILPTSYLTLRRYATTVSLHVKHL